MSVAATDLIFYHPASRAEDDTSTEGGAIDATMRAFFTQPAANDTVTAVSSSASDTQNVTVEGRNAAGQVVTETKAMTGVTGINLTNLGTIERITKVTLASAAAGTVTVARGTAGSVGATIGTITPGEKGFAMFLLKDATDPNTGKTYYAKIFIKNTHGSLALTSASVSESADPSGKFDFGLAAAVNDSVSVANRLTAPGGITFAGTAANVPGSDLAAGSAIGVWIRAQYSAGDAAQKTTWTPQIAGQSV